ncbi:MAG TPA: DMT family transporter [Streptosporangiaceae bacterium]|jgi:uncharacterized membrane protein|nr:DMT family transporter [Streptosporangiaceae bacterium]
MVVNVGPILIAFLSGWLLKEGFPPRLLAGMAVSFAGAVVVGLSLAGGGASPLLGVALCLVAAVTYAVGVVLQKPALKHASPLQVTTFGCLIGAAACLPFAGQLVRQAAAAPMAATLQIVYLGVFPTALAFSTWAYALSRTTAGKMGATTYAVPVLAVAMSWAFLGTVPGWLTLVGGLLCLTGVAVSRTRGGRDRADGSTEVRSLKHRQACRPVQDFHAHLVHVDVRDLYDLVACPRGGTVCWPLCTPSLASRRMNSVMTQRLACRGCGFRGPGCCPTGG